MSTQDLKHFIDLVQQGHRPGSSTSEKNCRLFAQVILEGAPGLDASATAGLIEFIGIAQMAPSTVRALIASPGGDA